VEKQTVEQLLTKLRELRVARGLTQEQFAEQSGMSYKYYQAVEAGRKRDLRLSTLERLATAHGLQVWELMRPSAENSRPSPKRRVAPKKPRPKK